MKFQMVILLLIALLSSFSVCANGLHVQVRDKMMDITKNDVEELQIFQSGKGVAAALLRLRPEAAERLQRLTEKNIGQQVLWIWKGRVLCAQKLRAPLGEDIAVHNFTTFEAEDFEKSTGYSINY